MIHIRSGSGLLQVPGTPEGGTLALVLPSTLRGAVVATVGKNNSGANRDGAEERSVPCPHNPRNLWQILNAGIEQNEKMKCCGQKYWDFKFTPPKILEHFGLQSTRETANLNAAKSLTGARVSSSC